MTRAALILTRLAVAIVAIAIVFFGAAPAATDGRWNSLDLLLIIAIFAFLWAAWPLLHKETWFATAAYPDDLSALDHLQHTGRPTP